MVEKQKDIWVLGKQIPPKYRQSNYYELLADQFSSSLTDPIVFCCLLLSAIKLQASTHCLISGAAWAKLLYRLAVLVTSILSTRGKETRMEKCITAASNTELEWLLQKKKRRLTNRSCQTMLLSLFVKHHFTARLFQDVFLCSLHQPKGAAAALPYAIHLHCRLTLIHQWRHAQEARYQFQEHLQKV